MESLVKKLIENRDYTGLRHALSENPNLANQGMPYDEKNTTEAPPLHRICDGVFAGKFTDEEAVNMARIFLDFGADIDGGALVEKRDTPLIAASSLHADKVAILYVEKGANIEHPGCHGGTALHWAAWCGRPKVVARLMQEGPEINKKCMDFKATPVFWAVHGLKHGDKKDLHDHLECVKILVQAGADKNIPNVDGNTVFDLINDEDLELKMLLK
jgi:hypothetical protein